MVLVKAFDLAGRGVEGDCRGSVIIVTRALIAHPRPAITRAPERQIGRGIVGAADPHRPAAGLPLVAVGPGFAAGLAGRRHRIGLPQRLAGLCVKSRDKAANQSLSPSSPTPRLVGWRSRISSGIGRLNRHRRSPFLASIANTWLPGVATNITPLLTIGGA